MTPLNMNFCFTNCEVRDFICNRVWNRVKQDGIGSNRFDVVIMHGKMPDLFTKLLNMEVWAPKSRRWILAKNMFGIKACSEQSVSLWLRAISWHSCSWRSVYLRTHKFVEHFVVNSSLRVNWTRLSLTWTTLSKTWRSMEENWTIPTT